MDIERLVDNRHVPIEKACRTGGNGQHFEVSGNDHIRPVDAAQFRFQRRGGGEDREDPLNETGIRCPTKRDDPDVRIVVQQVLRPLEAGHRDPCPTGSQHHHPPPDGGVGKIVCQVENMPRQRDEILVLLMNEPAGALISDQLSLQTTDCGNWQLSPRAVNATRSTIMFVGPL